MRKKEIKSTWKDRFLSPEEIAQMEAVFNERFFDFLEKDENAFFEGYFSNGNLFITLIISNEDESYYYPFETMLRGSENEGIDEEKARMALVDFIGTYFEDFFNNNRQTYIPIDWSPYTMDGIKFYAKAQVINKKLEKEADDILKSAGFYENEGNDEEEE